MESFIQIQATSRIDIKEYCIKSTREKRKESEREEMR